MPESAELGTLERQLLDGVPLNGDAVFDFDGVRVRVRTNSPKLAARLLEYFQPFVLFPTPAEAMFTVHAVERDEPNLGLAFKPWPREPGKVQGKEAVCDVPGGRVIRKVRTGMQFLVGPETLLAVGPCEQNVNQVINFLVFQYTEWWLQRGWLLCHAAGVTRNGAGIAIAARSGGGKSTLALTLMNHGYALVSNDRLLIKSQADRVSMRGVPKFPRINPGTALHNPHLHSLIPAEKRGTYQHLTPEELWRVEDKYDVPVHEIYGPGRFQLATTLRGVVTLDWTPDDSTPTTWKRLEVTDRPDLMPDLMKAPGPFFYDQPAQATVPSSQLDPSPYLETLSGVPLLIASGRVDFSSGSREIDALVS